MEEKKSFSQLIAEGKARVTALEAEVIELDEKMNKELETLKK